MRLRTHLHLPAFCSRLIGALPLIAAYGCASATAPVAEAHIQLRRLVVSDFLSVLTDSGFVTIEGYASDSTFRARRNERVPVTLLATSGDSEILNLGVEDCGPFGSVDCNDLLIALADGHDALELVAQLETLPARYHAVWHGGRAASLHVFQEDRIPRAILVLGRLPGVVTVERSVVGTVAAGGGPRAPVLRASMPLDFETPRVGDNRIQARRGDTLEIAYSQPDGTAIRFSMPLR